jgi:arylsulfatase A-like enzyme
MMRNGRWVAAFVGAVFASGAGVPLSATQPEAPRPNIVYILADDLGWKDVGFHGSDIATPSLDRLASGGAELAQFYAQPMCTPSRAALMTGRYPFRYGLQTAVIPSASTYGLADDEWLLPQALREAGYRTAIVGKWHLGHGDRKYWPRQRGFDSQYGPVLGEIDMSKSTIPADNGPWRDGKGTLYEGGTRVVALANWPGRIKPGSVVDEPIHIVDMYPTLAGLAGATLARCKPLDGMDAWPTIAAGGPSPRNEIVYNVGPFFAAVRTVDWKLVWRTALPSSVELFNLAADPSEQVNLADQHAEKVVGMQRRIEELARQSAEPLFLVDALGATKHVLFGSVATPAEQEDLVLQP